MLASEVLILVAVFISAILGLIFGLSHFIQVLSIKIVKQKNVQPSKDSDDEEDLYKMGLDERIQKLNVTFSSEEYSNLVTIGEQISDCALNYLYYEYTFIALFLLCFSIAIYVYLFYLFYIDFYMES